MTGSRTRGAAPAWHASVTRRSTARARRFDADLWKPGLGVFPGSWFGPHWDALDGFAPGFTDFIQASVPEGNRLVGIDENTAMAGDGRSWSVHGVGGVHVLEAGVWTSHPPGSAFELSLITEGG